MKMTTHCK